MLFSFLTVHQILKRCISITFDWYCKWNLWIVNSPYLIHGVFLFPAFISECVRWKWAYFRWTSSGSREEAWRSEGDDSSPGNPSADTCRGTPGQAGGGNYITKKETQWPGAAVPIRWSYPLLTGIKALWPISAFAFFLLNSSLQYDKITLLLIPPYRAGSLFLLLLDMRTCPRWH